jgi:DNA mismatch repair protein MSH5
MNEMLRLDRSSFKALHIFSEEFHPNVIKSKGKSKEGYSLFALFDRTKSLPGRTMLRSWMLRPFATRAAILNRQDAIQMTMANDNVDYISNVSKLLKHIPDLPRLILKIKKVTATYREWRLIDKGLSVGIDILRMSTMLLHQRRLSSTPLAAIFSQVNVNALNDLSEYFRVAIDFDSSEEYKTLMIREGYNHSLDTLRATFDALPQSLSRAAHLVLEQCPLLQNVTVDYIPQLGYLVAIDKSEENFIDTSDYEFKFEDVKLYYKCSITHEMDDSIGDIKNDLLDYQKRILRAIEEELLDKETQLHQLSSALGELDALISLGQIALERQYVRPEISDESTIIIKGGRHPLQEMTTTEGFIPNDTYLGPDKNVGLITGANASGKSVYIKQVGLLVYLAHLGSFLPCERAIIGLTDCILTRIASLETASKAQSSFTLDLNQVSHMLSSHTSRSLCLIDEFGKGTSPIDGIALVRIITSCVQHVRRHSNAYCFKACYNDYALC